MHTQFVVGNPEMKSQIGRSRRGWRVKGRQCEDMDLRFTIFIVFRSENYVILLRHFQSHYTENETVVSLNYLQNFLIRTKSLRPHCCHMTRCCCCT
jgi:hypothetical protein